MDNLIAFLSYAGRLKRLKRSGWVAQGIKDSESVADHSFGTAFLTMILSKNSGLDELKLLRMALIHDLAESIVGDIILERASRLVFSRAAKSKLESKAVKKITSNLKDGRYYLDLWIEYDRQKTPEARFVKQMDKLEMAFQAREYEKRNSPKKLDEFWISAEQYMQDQRVAALFRKLKSTRKKIHHKTKSKNR